MRRAALLILAMMTATPAWGGQPITIKLIDLSTPYSNGAAHWTPNDYSFAERALVIQLRAVAKYYAVERGFTLIGFGDKRISPMRVFIANECVDSDGYHYLAYHWRDTHGPYACIASKGGGGYWWMTRGMEHEVVEMIGDPSGNGREIVDPVARYFGEVVDGVFSFDYGDFAGTPFVDFLLPSRVSEFTDYLGEVARRRR